ncbi:YjiH family protein [Thermosediminibacter litoriperuensis]|uniref:Nucleoside recognition membrane protein YjiH n=1 Tax=Thermosediminibacter litoriperuensis TaxID=291989 RepID=A0A5S5AYD0_9FIRM|nr:YjiH family protein [Thermosediminibacter litoriperuensis]TYP58481.1 nucleoside recognition membrane protein YjiH [Thermosediminibacter litoriperuensis]
MDKTRSAWRFIVFSAIGFFVFFIPVNWKGSSSIPLDHIVSWIRTNLTSFALLYAVAVTTVGGLLPWVNGSWRKSKVDTVFSVFKLAGILIAFMVYFKIGPAWMMESSMGPFLFEKLVVPVGLIVPVGSVFLAFLIGYGLMEFVGTFLRPMMRLIWKTPGKSAIDAIASFVGSYSIALLITNRVFKEGKYTIKEAAIIATGFSTVSATFMIIVAKTLNLMDMWNTYFWSALVVTFAVTAVTARIWPLSRKPDSYATEPNPEKEISTSIAVAWEEALKAAADAPGILESIAKNIRDGFRMAASILPTIMSIGLLGLVLANYTPIFDFIGWIYYPFMLLLRVPEPVLASKAAAVEVAEMFLPALLTANAPLVTRFVTAIVSISAILFFSASIPCILSTEIPLTITEIIVIWIERTIFSIVFAAILAMILL